MTGPLTPPDNHVHTQWSWDAPAGSMERSCARAVELGLPSIAFTEHVDATRWAIPPQAAVRRHADKLGPDGRFDPPPLDTAGYLACVERCRERFPGLRILSGLELGEPHWFEAQVREVLATGAYDRVLGSLHSVEVGGEPWIVDLLQERDRPGGLTQDGIMRAYLAEALRLVESPSPFAVLAHVDYPVRSWSAGAGAFDPTAFEEEYRAVLAALARSGRALEVNTRLPLRAEIVGWWWEAGGGEVSFGSDAHGPSQVAQRFAGAAAMVEAHGFRPGSDPHDLWRRR